MYEQINERREEWTKACKERTMEWMQPLGKSYFERIPSSSPFIQAHYNLKSGQQR